jgi:2-amino-4-hydroxy-6-hydroxymethyldihydropteridine diphosphokinase
MRSHVPIVAYIALGANLGDRRANIERAVDMLRMTEGVAVNKVSALIETDAVGGPAGSPPFLNGAAELHTTLPAHPLLHRMLQIERELGRERRERWEPRLIDLDLLLYGDHILSSDELIVPHPLMHERLFVLKPLAEIAPDVVHPSLQMSVRGLLTNLTASARRP